MEFKKPIASRKRLEQLLEYLGSRARDFKKCFDVESKWCWKYADLVLRGTGSRDIGYMEGHHIVPACFYGKRHSKAVDSCNKAKLSYSEHLYAHRCAALCAIGDMKGKMATAFITMYNIGVAGKRPLDESETEFIKSLPEREIKRLLSMSSGWGKVEAEGRTHLSEDPRKAKREWYATLSVEQKRGYVNYETRRKHRAENVERFRENAREYYYSNHDAFLQWSRESYARNHDVFLERKRAEYAENPEKFRKRNREQYETHKESRVSYAREYRAKRIEAGYRFRKDPVTGKRGWVFVGLPGKSEAA